MFFAACFVRRVNGLCVSDFSAQFASAACTMPLFGSQRGDGTPTSFERHKPSQYRHWFAAQAQTHTGSNGRVASKQALWLNRAVQLSTLVLDVIVPRLRRLLDKRRALPDEERMVWDDR